MSNLKVNILYFLLFFLFGALVTLCGVYVYIELSGISYKIDEIYSLLEDATIVIE